MYFRSLLAPLLLLPVMIAVVSSAASVGLLMHYIQHDRYHLLDLLLDAGAHAMYFHLHVLNDGLTIFQC